MLINQILSYVHIFKSGVVLGLHYRLLAVDKYSKFPLSHHNEISKYGRRIVGNLLFVHRALYTLPSAHRWIRDERKRPRLCGSIL